MTRSEILEEACMIVCGERNRQYGSPEDNFTQIAHFWSTYLHTTITPVDVAMLMILLKIARINTGGLKEDSFIDIAGYAACGGEIAEKMNLTKENEHENK